MTRVNGEHTVRLVAGEPVPHEFEPGATLPERGVRARNLFRDAANRIHDDAGARELGYAGALVAGITIYGYLARVVVEALGVEWLRRGTATVRFARPVYDGDLLTLSGRIVGRSGRRDAGELVAEIEGRGPSGEIAATLTAGLAWGGPVAAADPRGYAAAPLPASPAPATAETLAGSARSALRLVPGRGGARPGGSGSRGSLVELSWPPGPRPPGPPAPSGEPGAVRERGARPLGPRLERRGALGPGAGRDGLETRGRVARLYERKGRGWVDLDLLIVAGGGRPVARIRHTAIYRMSALAGSEDRRGGTP